MAKFEEVYAINVNDKVEKKGNLSYLSWCYAWAEFKKIYPDANYKITQFDGTFCTGNDKLGYMVHTTVTADNQTYEMWLPVMDMRNKALLNPTMFDINKTIMRCLTKNIGMFGLGLYIYAGEDLPDGEEVDEKPIKKPTQAPKVEEKGKSFKPLTRVEMTANYGVRNVEETIVWFEGKFGVEFAKWDEEMTMVAREKLRIKKEKREAEERANKELQAIGQEDIPFPIS